MMRTNAINNTTNPFAVSTTNKISSSHKKKDQKKKKKRKRTSTRKNKNQDDPSKTFTIFQNISTERREVFYNLLNTITHSDEYGCRQPKSNEGINWDKFNEIFRSLISDTKAKRKEILSCRDDTMLNNQRTLLMYLLSIEGGPPEDIVSTLLDIDPSAVRMKEKSFRNWTCLTFAIYYNASIEVIQRLVDAYPEETPLFKFVEKDGGDNTPLHFLQSNTSLEIVEIILKKFPSIASGKNTKGLFPLHVATAQKKLSLGIIRRLLDAYPKAILEKNDEDNKSIPLHLACQNMNVPLEEIKLLLKHDVEKKTMLRKDNYGWLPLRYACENNVSVDVMQFLLHSFIHAKMKCICDIPFYRSKIDNFLKTTLLIEEVSKENYVSYYEKIEKFTSHCNLIESTTLLELNLQKENCLHGIVVIMNRTLDFINEKNGPDRMVYNDDDEEESIDYNNEKNSKNDGILHDGVTEDETSDEELSL